MLMLVIVQCSIVSCHLRLRRNGDDRVRTDGLRLARAALSQLSYIPLPKTRSVMGLGRVELPTSRLSGVRSNHLSYRPSLSCNGLLPPTFSKTGLVCRTLRQTERSRPPKIRLCCSTGYSTTLARRLTSSGRSTDSPSTRRQTARCTAISR